MKLVFQSLNFPNHSSVSVSSAASTQAMQQLSNNNLTLIRIYELLSIIKDVSGKIPSNQPLSIAEFCTFNYLLQVLSNNIMALSKADTATLEFMQPLFTQEGAWVKTDRLTITHAINMQEFYESNKDHVRLFIATSFFQNGFFNSLGEYLKSKNLTPLIRSYELDGNITGFKAIEALLKASDLSLPVYQLQDHSKISEAELGRTIYYHTILLQSVITEHSGLLKHGHFAACIDVQAVIINIYQIIGNAIKLFANITEDDLNDTILQNYVLARNYYAHTIKLASINLEEFLHNFGCNSVLISELSCLCPAASTMAKSLTKFTTKQTAANKAKAQKVDYEESKKPEQTLEQSSASVIKQNANDVKKSKPERNLDKILEGLSNEIEQTPSIHSLSAQSYDISRRIIDIIKDAYNGSKSLTQKAIQELKELIAHPLFDPNKYINCQYKGKLQKLYALEITDCHYNRCKLIKTLESADQNFATKKRPVDLLVQIAVSPEVIEIVGIILDLGANPIRRDKELFSLVEYSILCDSTEALKLILTHIAPHLVAKVLDGNVKGAIEDGWKVSTCCNTPHSLSLELGREQHAVVLSQYDKELASRIITLNLLTHQGEIEVVLHVYGDALRRKLFQFLESLFDNQYYKDTLIESIYADYMGKEYKKGSNIVKPIGFFRKHTNLHEAYSHEDYKTLLSIFIKHGVDLSLIPSLYTHSSEIAVEAVCLIDYDVATPQSIITLAKIASSAAKHKALNVLNAIIAHKQTTLKELIDSATKVQAKRSEDESNVSFCQELQNFYMRYCERKDIDELFCDEDIYESRKQKKAELITAILSGNKVDLATEMAIGLDSPQILCKILSHIEQVQNSSLKHEVINYFTEHKESLAEIPRKDLPQILSKCPDLINEIAEILLNNGATALECSSLLKRIENMDLKTKARFTAHVKQQASKEGATLEIILYKKLSTNLENSDAELAKKAATAEPKHSMAAESFAEADEGYTSLKYYCHLKLIGQDINQCE